MILKASDALRRLIFQVKSSGPEMTIHPGAFPEKQPDMSNIPPIPEWLRAMLLDGSVMVVDPQEYTDLPPEIKAYLEVLSN